MSVGTYIGIAMLVAFYFAIEGKLEDGDHSRGLTMLIAAALWPVSIAFGAGLCAVDVYRWIRRKIA